MKRMLSKIALSLFFVVPLLAVACSSSGSDTAADAAVACGATTSCVGRTDTGIVACNTCMEAHCCDQIVACLNDCDCVALDGCFQTCDPNDGGADGGAANACVDGCFAAHAEGKPKSDAIDSCAATACKTECQY